MRPLTITTFWLILATITCAQGVESEVLKSEKITVPTLEKIPDPRETPQYLWVVPTDLQQYPMSGDQWEAIKNDAAKVGRVANIGNSDSHHDTYTLAAALVAVRTGDPEMREAAIDGLTRAIGTENAGRRDWLAVGRNLGSYVIAADILEIRSGRIHEWIVRFLDAGFQLEKNVGSGDRPMKPFESGSNASAQEGFAYAAVAAYAGDREALDRCWDAFRTYAGDPTAPDSEDINISAGIEYGWSHAPSKAAGATAVVPAGVTRNAIRLDGAIINDMRRGGEWGHPPGHTSYPWVGMEGFVSCALVLERSGYPAFEVADRAVLRAAEYLWWLHTEVDDYWWDAAASCGRAREVKHLINWRYGTKYPHPVTGGGRISGYTGWTHPLNTGSSVGGE